MITKFALQYIGESDTEDIFVARVLNSILALIVLASPALAQERAYFKDWLADCRADGYCSATAYDNPNPPSGIVADYILRIGRPAQGNYWEISLATVAEMPGDWPEFNFLVDSDNEFIFTPPYDTGAYASINDFFMLGEKATPLLETMILGSQVQVDFETESGDITLAQFSLSGLAAAMLWIDEQQRRIGSERVALTAPLGLTPVSKYFPARIPPNLLTLHNQDTDCENFAFLPHANEVIQSQVTDDQWIWMIPCGAGAYNFTYKAYMGAWNGDYFTSLIFADYSDNLGWSGDTHLFNPQWDEQTKTFTTFYKGRGIGDCGSTGKWQWHEYGFRLLEFWAKDHCDAQGNPGEFPLIWQFAEDAAKGK